MFWSLILEPSKRYSSTVKESFHLTMATLDARKVVKDNEIYPVQLEIDGEELLLCNLSKPHFLQVNLDLMFEKGTDVTFSTSGKATIHLTGYLVNDEDTEDEYSSFGDEEDSTVDSLNKFKEDLAKSAAAQKGAAKQGSPSKRKLEPAEAVSKKKQKNVKIVEEEDDDDDSSIDETELGKLVDSINEQDIDTESDDELDDEEDEEGAEEEESEGEGEEDLDSSLGDSDSDSDDENSEEEPTKQQKPTKQEIKTPQPNKQVKTPVSNKKQEKQQAKNQLTNGVTPTSTKKDKKEKNQANQATPKQGNLKNQKQDNQKTPKQENQKTPKKGKEENATPQSQKKPTTVGGVVIEELKPGNGAVAKAGKMVAVYYTGRLKNNNRVFDQSNQGAGFKFRIGNGEVIKAWDVGVNGMKVGSKRRITCPPAMAYGNKGSPPQIPPNSWLVFDVELKSVY